MVVQVAGVRHPISDARLLAAKALNLLQDHITSLENEVQDLKIKCKLLWEEACLSKLRCESSLSSPLGMKDSSKLPSLCSSPSMSSFRWNVPCRRRNKNAHTTCYLLVLS